MNIDTRKAKENRNGKGNSVKYLLTAINAKYIHSNLAVYSLKASAGIYRDAVEIVEFTIHHPRQYLLQELYKRKPDVLCFSCYIWNIGIVEETATEFHKLCPDVPIWVGGPEVSYEVGKFLDRHPAVFGIMRNEGEETFRELCSYYDKKMQGQMAQLSEIAGIAFRKEGLPYLTRERAFLDMSTIPFCYGHLEDFSNRIIYYESSRGCPFSCSYCLSSVEKTLRFRNLDLVQKELQFFLDHSVPQVKFVDRTFNCNHEHAMAIWTYIRDHDNGITNFHFEVSADLFLEEELNLIGTMRPGLIQLEIGVQSTNEATLQEIHRSMRLKRLKEAVLKIQSFGNVHEHLDLIAGLPYEDYGIFQTSFDEIYALKPNQLQLGFLKVLKGSYLYGHTEEYGLLFQEKPPYEVLQSRWLPYRDILRIKQVEEMLEVYYNSGQFEITIKILEFLFPGAFLLYQTLGEFYEKEGIFGQSHTRNQRAEILLRFAKERQECKEHTALLQEALTFDLYYRENCKSRPAWAPDPGTFRHMTHAYCRDGKQSHVEPFHYRFPQREERTLRYLPEYQRNTLWVLFHYDKREPLSHQAGIEYVEEEVWWQQKEPWKS